MSKPKHYTKDPKFHAARQQMQRDMDKLAGKPVTPKQEKKR